MRNQSVPVKVSPIKLKSQDREEEEIVLRLKAFIGVVSVLEEESLNLNKRDRGSKVYSFILFFRISG